SLIATNALVPGCWHLESLRHFMETPFMHHFGSRRDITSLSSCFSHQNVIFHFTSNMVLLYLYLGPVQELSNRHEIAVIYLSSGIFGSAASHAYSLAQYRIFKQKLVPNLEASGALLDIM
ncbi:hypothetical protein BJV82DRAFT_496224, partial [Fennellomyces sp. T-0311]